MNQHDESVLLDLSEAPEYYDSVVIFATINTKLFQIFILRPFSSI